MDDNSRAPLGDKTNIAKQADAKERKRERDRVRWQEKKDTINKRRRDAYGQKQQQHVIGTTNCIWEGMQTVCYFDGKTYKWNRVVPPAKHHGIDNDW